MDISHIKEKLDIDTVAAKLGLVINGNKNIKCPRHGGVSFHIYPDSWHCFGECKQGGDIVDLWMFVEKCDFLEAAKALAQLAGVPWTHDPAELAKQQARREIEHLLDVAATFYHDRYAGSPAETYAISQSYNLDEAKLGYAPDSWTALVSYFKTEGISLEQAAQAGLIAERDQGGYYDVLRHRLIIPVYKSGRCVYLQGRELGTASTVNEAEQKKKYKNIQLGNKPLYAVNGAMRASVPVITESTSDVLRLTSVDAPAVGLLGSSINEFQAQQIKRFKSFVLAGHNDPAGVGLIDSLAAVHGEAMIISIPPTGYNDWREAIDAGQTWSYDPASTYVRFKLHCLDPKGEPTLLKKALEPLLTYLASLDDHAMTALYLEEIRAYFGWSAITTRAYDRQIKEMRNTRIKLSQEQNAIKSDDSGATFQMMRDVDFINPAQALHNGIVYVSRAMTRRVEHVTKTGSKKMVDVHGPMILTSDRRALDCPQLPMGSPLGTILYLDPAAKTVAIRNPIYQATTNWSYDAIKTFLDGAAVEIKPADIYDRLMTSLRSYVYFQDPNDYVIAVLWAMGTYVHQTFDAFPYLALNGHKGAGKSTFLHWLSMVCFNASHIVNSSEASLYRWIETAAPTLLIDEQEGLNSRQAAKEGKADLMGLLKAGYQKGATVTRQDTNDPRITQVFYIYSPKALAAVEQFEDILADRAILVYLFKPEQKSDLAALKQRQQMTIEEFQPLRDDLYLFLMQYAAFIDSARLRIRSTHENRYGELTLPLLTIAATIDASRGDGQNTILAQLEPALANQSSKREARNELTPEKMLEEAIRLVIADAEDTTTGHPSPSDYAQRLPDGRIVMDALHISDKFRSLFPTAKESYFRLEWLGKQVAKTTYIKTWEPKRWRRMVNERNELTHEIEPTPKQPTVYVIDLKPEVKK